MLSLRLTFNLDYFLGLLVAFPLVYPGPPFYISSFTFLLLVLPRVLSQHVRIDIISLALLFLYSASLVLSTILSSGAFSGITYTALVGGFVFLLFFVFSHYVFDVKAFFVGFLHGTLVLCLTVIVLFFALDASAFGIRILYVPEYRMWAEGFIPDWPNYIVFFFCCATLLSVYLKKSFSLPFFIVLTAALMTTSRLAPLAIFFVALLFLCIKPSRSMFVLLAFFLVAIFFYSSFQFNIDSQLIDRMAKSGDRESLFNNLVSLWLDRPFLGYGAIYLGSIPGLAYDSFHNSYLEALVKGGFVGFLFFALFLLRGFFVIFESCATTQERAMLIVIFLFFLIASLFQNYLKHPHVIILYSIIFYRHTNSCRFGDVFKN